MKRVGSGIYSNDAKSPVCWEMQQQEVITIVFFRVEEDSCREVIHHGMPIPKGTLCFEEPDRRCKNAAYVADANVCSTFYVHFGHCTSANPKGNAVFRRALCRQVVQQGICVRSPREIPDVVGDFTK